MTGPRTLGAAGVALIQHFEGCSRRRASGDLQAYPDPGTGGAPWTVGWGSTGPDIGRGTIWTQAQADARFARDTGAMAAKVATMIGAVPTTGNQFDALVAFAYNLGASALAGSTLIKLHRTGDHAGAQAEFAKWNHAEGKVLPGLTLRRAAEAALYAKD